MEATIRKKYDRLYVLEYKENWKNVVLMSEELKLLLREIRNKVDNLTIIYV